MHGRHMITSQEILDQLDIKASKTLIRWHQRGLIPKPEIGTHPNGRGKISYWPDWVLPRCRRIRDLVAKGHTLDDIQQKNLLESPEEQQETTAPKRRYCFQEVSVKLVYEEGRQYFADVVFERLEPLLKSLGCDLRTASATLDGPLFSRELIDELLDLLRTGFNPVLVFDGSNMQAMSDVAVSHFLARTANDGTTPLLVLPVFHELAEAFEKTLGQVPKQPTLRPASRITSVENGQQVEHKCKVTKSLKIQFKR